MVLLRCYRITEEEYVKAIKEEINKVVKLQEELDIDVLVHGEPEVSLLSPLEDKEQMSSQLEWFRTYVIWICFLDSTVY